MDLSAPLRHYRIHRSAAEFERTSIQLRDTFEPVWRRLAEYVGLHHVTHTVTGPTVITPTLCSVDSRGPHLVLVVELLPGQLLGDLRILADRLAPALAAGWLRFTPRGDRWVRIEMLPSDPLDIEVRVPAGQGTEVFVGQTEHGAAVSLDWHRAPHVIVQGATRSGKSVWCYSVLGQLAGQSDVLIAGSDPSGILLGRPYAGTVHAGWQVTGTANIAEHVDLLRRLVAEMDTRIGNLPAAADTSDEPLVLVVLEEFGGLVRLANLEPAPKGEPKLADQLRALFGRLVSEGHKAGMRLLVVSQRADASVLGGYERGQLGMRVSFRTADPEALAMLHDQGREWYPLHCHAPAGVALLESPDIPLTRIRGPRLATTDQSDYGVYCDQIAGVTARLRGLVA